MEVTNNYKERREIFMETFRGDTILTKKIPEITAGLFYDEFDINIHDLTHIPIVFTIAWQKILEFVGDQHCDEFAIDVCGLSLEYRTEYSESDKSTNIVPQMLHKKTPIFMKQKHQIKTGSTFTDELLKQYNSWRTVNLTETLDKIERDVYSIALNEYGIDLMVSATVFPLITATYAAGLQLAKETKETINMYNIFEIDCLGDEDKIVITPLSTVKQYLKNDSKK